MTYRKTNKTTVGQTNMAEQSSIRPPNSATFYDNRHCYFILKTTNKFVVFVVFNINEATMFIFYRIGGWGLFPSEQRCLFCDYESWPKKIQIIVKILLKEHIGSRAIFSTLRLGKATVKSYIFLGHTLFYCLT